MQIRRLLEVTILAATISLASCASAPMRLEATRAETAVLVPQTLQTAEAAQKVVAYLQTPEATVVEALPLAKDTLKAAEGTHLQAVKADDTAAQQTTDTAGVLELFGKWAGIGAGVAVAVPVPVATTVGVGLGLLSAVLLGVASILKRKPTTEV